MDTESASLALEVDRQNERVSSSLRPAWAHITALGKIIISITTARLTVVSFKRQTFLDRRCDNFFLSTTKEMIDAAPSSTMLFDEDNGPG